MICFERGCSLSHRVTDEENLLWKLRGANWNSLTLTINRTNLRAPTVPNLSTLLANKRANEEVLLSLK